MRGAGFEPTPLSGPGPKPGASANSATLAGEAGTWAVDPDYVSLAGRCQRFCDRRSLARPRRTGRRPSREASARWTARPQEVVVLGCPVWHARLRLRMKWGRNGLCGRRRFRRWIWPWTVGPITEGLAPHLAVCAVRPDGSRLGGLVSSSTQASPSRRRWFPLLSSPGERSCRRPRDRSSRHSQPSGLLSVPPRTRPSSQGRPQDRPGRQREGSSPSARCPASVWGWTWRGRTRPMGRRGYPGLGQRAC